MVLAAVVAAVERRVEAVILEWASVGDEGCKGLEDRRGVGLQIEGRRREAEWM